MNPVNIGERLQCWVFQFILESQTLSLKKNKKQIKTGGNTCKIFIPLKWKRNLIRITTDRDWGNVESLDRQNKWIDINTGEASSTIAENNCDDDDNG